jgi:methylated-DNA-protein-cysteine methyltransferase-like protein
MIDPSKQKRARIYSVVALIPEGRVTTYGEIAVMAGIPGQARQVGYALAALTDAHELPWHRVINAKGEVSQRVHGADNRRQQALLENEGIEFDASGRTSLARFGWRSGQSGSAKT